MGGHHKKLSDCLIDAKWPRILRADTLLLTCVAADGDEVVNAQSVERRHAALEMGGVLGGVGA